MRVWIDGQLKIDFKGISNHPSKGKEQSLRYGLYNSSMSRYKNIFETNKMPQRIIFFDGVRSEKKCEKLLSEIWNYNKEIDTHTLETHMYSLRKKIDEKLQLKDLIIYKEKKGYVINGDFL